MRRLLTLAMCLMLRSPVLSAETPDGRPEIWMVPPALPDGHCLRELFTQPDQWKDTRSKITVLGCFDHFLNKQYEEDELRAWLPMVDKWGLKFGLEVGAVKPWGTTGEAVFEAERPMWERFQSLGGRIYAMAMDEPLFCVLNDLKKPAEYAVEETAQFVALVRRHYPGVRIGDIEPYPAIPLPELIGWIDALQARLKQMDVPGLDFLRLDVDWVHLTVGQRGNWQEVRRVEEACRAMKISFSLIYWAADYGALERLGLADDATWYISVMRQGNGYAMVGGSPDEYVIESWIPAPSRCVPDAGEWTFTRYVRDFSDRFVRPKVSTVLPDPPVPPPAASGNQFAIAVLPDLQGYTQSYDITKGGEKWLGKGYPYRQRLDQQVRWIVDNREKYNIRFAVCLGDDVQHFGYNRTRRRTRTATMRR